MARWSPRRPRNSRAAPLSAPWVQSRLRLSLTQGMVGALLSLMVSFMVPAYADDEGPLSDADRAFVEKYRNSAEAFKEMEPPRPLTDRERFALQNQCEASEDDPAVVVEVPEGMAFRDPYEGL